jgi:membrane protease YdiL (CAAX protease family)
MDGILLFFGIYLGAIALAVPLTPAVHALVRYWDQNHSSALSAYLFAQPPSRIFSRILWISLALGLTCLLRRRNLLSWKRLGIQWERRWQGICFFALGLFLSLIPCALQMLLWGWEWAPRRPLWQIIPHALVSAITVALLEEIVFRGLLLRILGEVLTPLAAALVGALFFAHCHFRIPISIGGPGAEGLCMALGTLLGFGGAFFHPVSFLSLLLLGLLLGLWFLHFRQLMPSIGFHGGIVFVLLLYRRTIQLGSHPSFPIPGPGNPIDFFLCPVLLLVLLYFSRNGRRPDLRHRLS